MGAKAGIVKRQIRVPDEQDRDKLAFTLTRIFSSHECQEWIAMAEEKGYSVVRLNVGGGREILAPNYRNSDRCVINSPELAQKLFARLEPFLPRIWQNGSFELVGLNERLRFFLYSPGHKFHAHTDGAFRRQDGSDECSFLTVQLYLNENFEGGETTFVDTENHKRNVPFVIKTGMVLIFQHRIMHEETEVRKGCKYTMQTDVMYRPVGKAGGKNVEQWLS